MELSVLSSCYILRIMFYFRFSIFVYIEFALFNYVCLLVLHLTFSELSQVRDVFLPWYNAYRFLVQNSKRLEVEGLARFVPIEHVTLQKSSNVLDQWINSATQSLVHFVRQEMDGYRLYTVSNTFLIVLIF